MSIDAGLSTQNPLLFGGANTVENEPAVSSEHAKLAAHKGTRNLQFHGKSSLCVLVFRVYHNEIVSQEPVI